MFLPFAVEPENPDELRQPTPAAVYALLAVILAYYVLRVDTAFVLGAGVMAVVGHNWMMWLGFRGGRGAGLRGLIGIGRSLAAPANSGTRLDYHMNGKRRCRTRFWYSLYPGKLLARKRSSSYSRHIRNGIIAAIGTNPQYESSASGVPAISSEIQRASSD